MIEIEKPNIVTQETSEDGRYGKFVVEPLERGFGTTLGNSLRRVLLSALPGVAVVSIKIDGVLHEITTVNGVKEDVTEIVLNVKRIAAKLHTDGPKTVLIDMTGPCDVKAGDIKADGEVGDYITMPSLKGNCPFVDQTPTRQICTMKGQDVYKFVANIIPPYITDDILAKNNIYAEDIDYLVLHQANQRIIKAVQERLGYDDSKVISNIEKLGNTSASSILIAIGEGIKDGKIKTPSKAIICGFGAGMCWGGGVINLRDGIFKQENIFQK